MAAARLSPHRDGDTPRPWVAMIAWSALSLLPDLDVIAFAFGIPYEHVLGHRGASHSIGAAVVLGVLVGLLARVRGRRFLPGFALASLVVTSHSILDMMTTGGLGAAFFWPFSGARFFLPWRPIPVAPIGPAFLTDRGLSVALTELAMFCPLVAFALWPRRGAADHHRSSS